MKPLPDDFAEACGCACFISEDGSVTEVEVVGEPPQPETFEDENLNF